jgi:hypothetical protein
MEFRLRRKQYKLNTHRLGEVLGAPGGNHGWYKSVPAEAYKLSCALAGAIQIRGRPWEVLEDPWKAPLGA